MNYVGNWKKDLSKLYPVSLDNVTPKGFIGNIVDENANSIIKGFESTIGELFLFLRDKKELSSFHDRLAAESDTFKLVEGACYAYSYTKNEKIKEWIDINIDAMLLMQEEDGFILHPNKTRMDEKYFHDLYIIGHFIEMVVAHYEVFKDEKLIDATKKWIDTYIKYKEENHPYYEKVKSNEHAEIELGLVRFYRITKDKKYLDFSKWIAEKYEVAPYVGECLIGIGDTHVVRFNYLLSALVELYIETGDKSFIENVENLVNEIIDTRSYITGGVGDEEWYPKNPYMLRQTGRIAETCGSISFIMLLWRLFHISPKAKYLNAIENIFYNHLMGALNKEQDSIFYYNPIRYVAKAEKGMDWCSLYKRVKLPIVHGCSCCFPNAWRFFGQLPEYIFSVNDDSVYVNIFTSADSVVNVNGEDIKIKVETNYPFDGKIDIYTDKPCKIKVRKPNWCELDEVVADNWTYADEFYTIECKEHASIEFGMKIKLMTTNSFVSENNNQVAVTYGPIVFMMEGAQADGRIDDLCLDVNKPMSISFEGDYPIVTAEFKRKVGQTGLYTDLNNISYKDAGKITLIPYYAIARTEDATYWTTLIPTV